MNTEPDEYHCACPDGYSGKNCEIGQCLNTTQETFRFKDLCFGPQYIWDKAPKKHKNLIFDFLFSGACLCV